MGMFGLIFGRITFEKINLKELLLEGLLLKEFICVWFEYVKSKFKIIIFV